MHKLLSKLDSIKGRGPQAGDSVTSNSTTDDALPINQADIYKYRRHRGVNLGSWFVLERWITASPFKYAAHPAQSDLDIARGSDAKQVLEAHWDTWITDEDWTWISKMGLNAVRIPIGYYHLCGADRRVLDGTDFANYNEVYEGAWSRIIGACTKAESLGIGVLLDLHAAPGGQNASSHSGTSDPHPKFFAHTHNQRNTIYILKSLLQSLSSHNLSNIIGIELLNEPDPPSDTALTKWYTRSMSELQSLNTGIPLYLGECWRTGVYTEYLANHPPLGMAVLDHHLYRCFTAEDIRTSVDDHIRAMDDPNGISHVLSSASEKVGRVGGGLVVGEWSGALNPGSLAGISNENEKKKAYVAAQLRMFDRSCGGWFFWTYKKEMAGDTGWSLRDSEGAGVFPSFVGIPRDEPRINQVIRTSRTTERDLAHDQALAAHTQFWDQYPGSYDHSFFGRGFILGWNYAYQFICLTPPSSQTVSEIGFFGAWASRLARDLNLDVKGKHYWEFEHGLTQGCGAALNDYKAM